ncbi:MAG: hypothetical protein WAV27_14000 [Xanthobacteraceae bacterium]|jgi:hypothetical protein
MTVTQSKKPTHRIYAVRKTDAENLRWFEIGAAWPNKDGKGYSVKLNLMPVGEADIVIREIEPETNTATEEGGAQCSCSP